ncbi:hypothetical protein LTSEMIN_1419, partial [Salmonella enterica subsp. enterica serovar Minnesota str. A4-603]
MHASGRFIHNDVNAIGARHLAYAFFKSGKIGKLFSRPVDPQQRW